MDGNEFRRLLRIGHGRAILYTRNHDVAEFRDLILNACLHCLAFDPIFEGTRAAYLLDLIDFTPDRSFYAKEVLKSLEESDDNWDAVQRFHYAACLALGGDEYAKKIMYENFKPGPKFAEHIGCEFVELDGLSGFLFVAEKIGRILGNRLDEIDMGHLLWRCGRDLAHTTGSSSSAGFWNEKL